MSKRSFQSILTTIIGPLSVAVKKTAILVLCLAAMALVCLNIHLYREFKRLSLNGGNGSVPAVTMAADTAQKVIEPNISVAEQAKRSEEIVAFKSRLAAKEEELEKANKQWGEITAERDKKRKEEKEQRNAGLRISTDMDVDNLVPFLLELNVSSEKIESYRRLVLECKMAVLDEYDRAGDEVSDTSTNGSLTEKQQEEQGEQTSRREDEIRMKYERKYEELFGEETYARIVEYKKTEGERGNVFEFNLSLGQEEMLTKDQKKALIKVIYDERERESKESMQNSSQTSSAGFTYTDEEISDSIRSQEQYDARIIDGAGDILSRSQLDKLTEYLKTRRENYLLQLKAFQATDE